MRRWLILPILACMLTGCPVTQPRPPGDIARLREATTNRRYYLYVPTWYDDETDWPVVITLHGTDVWDGPKRQALEWGYLAERHGFIVIAPQLDGVHGILGVSISRLLAELAGDDEAILTILDAVAEDYNIDPTCVMLTGFSAGGFPLWYTGLNHPERFHVLVARACNSRIDLFESIQLTDRARQLPIFIFWGKDDLGPIQRQGWQAFRYLRQRRFFNCRRKEAQGGHLRRPEIAMRFWLEHLPPRHRNRAVRRNAN